MPGLSHTRARRRSVCREFSEVAEFSRRVKRRDIVPQAHSPRTTTRLLLAVPPGLWQEGLTLLLGDESADFDLGEALSLRGAAQLLQKQPWDLVILDLALCGRNGPNVLRQTREKWPGLRIVAFDSAGKKGMAEAAREAGISAYLDRDSTAEDLLKAARKALPRKAG